MKYEINLQEQLSETCAFNDMNQVKNLLLSPKYNLDIHASRDSAFISAARCGHLSLVKFLLTSPLLKEHSHINERGLDQASRNGHLHIVEYLTSSPDLKSHCTNFAGAILEALKGKRYNVVSYFLYEHHFQLEAERKNILGKINLENEVIKTFYQMVEKRDLLLKLNFSFSAKNHQSKNKI